MPTMRDRFSQVMTDLLQTDPRTAVVLADIGTDRFAGVVNAYPERVINVGIREQTMIGVASGLALEGFRPVAHSYAPFLVERAFEQLKVDFGHQGVGAVLVSVGASHDWAAGGRTHHAPGDVALLATLPGWEIHVPGHPDEVERLLRHSISHEGPAYIRLTEKTNQTAVEVEPNRFKVLRQSRSAKATVIAVGPMLDGVREALGSHDVNLLYATTVRPFDRETLRQVVAQSQSAAGMVADVWIVEPYLVGTSSDRIAEALKGMPTRIYSHGVPLAEHRKYGTASDHDHAFGLDAAGIRDWLLREELVSR